MMNVILKMKGKQMSKAIYVCAVCNSDKIRQLSWVNYNSRKELYPNVKFQKDLDDNNAYEIVCNNCDDDVDKDIVVKEMEDNTTGLSRREVNWEMSKEMERYLGKTVYSTNGVTDNVVADSLEDVDPHNEFEWFQMTLDKIAYEKIGGITDELEDSDFPVFVSKELDSWCSLEWIEKIYKDNK